MATRKPSVKPSNGPRWQSSGSPDDLEPAEQIAHEILTGRRDLLPSVERIMTADLGEAGTLRAISLFRDALSNPGDVHRDPRVAIAESASAAGGASSRRVAKLDPPLS
jgi:hypothetical protein